MIQQQQPPVQPPQQYRNDQMKQTAIALFALFAVGFFMHVFGAIFTLFVVLACVGFPMIFLGFALYVAGFVCLCLI